MNHYLNKFVSWYFSKNALPYWIILLADCLTVVFSGYVAKYLEIGGDQFAGCFWQLTLGLCLSLLFYILAFRIFHTYSGVVRYSSFSDLKSVALANIMGAVLTAVFSKSIRHFAIASITLPTLSGIFVMMVLSVALMWMVRIAVKLLYDTARVDEKTSRALIFGVASGAVSIAKSIRNEMPQKYSLVGFISPDGTLVSSYLMGAKVYPASPDLINLIKKEGVSAVIVSPLQNDLFRSMTEFVNALIMNGIKIMIFPQAEVWDGVSELHHSALKEVQIEDLLPREKIEISLDNIASQIKGKSIFITGAAGSIGSEIVRQVASFGPSMMILVDQAETPMHDIRLMMRNDFPEIVSYTLVATITDAVLMEKLFAEYRPDYVFHAAAYKHVPMMEDNPCVAITNNVLGTRIVADLSVRYAVSKFVMISTDKAVNPTNVMGCSKRICEIYCQSLNKAVQDGKCPAELCPGKDINGGVPRTQFVTTRFGNVLGSNGSVIPIFREQIKRGGPVTVTHPDIIRYFMLIPEACKLVLEAGTLGKGGEIFVFDMGKPVRIVDLAKRMIALSGAKNVKIEFSGLRSGEKLFEEVLSNEENTKPTVHPKILVASVREYDYDDARAAEDRLLKAAQSCEVMETVRIMKSIVPEYKSRNSVYEVLDTH